MQKNMHVLVAFSGGIDSCAAVEILKKQGYRVEAYTIDMLSDEQLLQQARSSAQRLEIPLHIENARELFRNEIIEDFCTEYFAGRTPAPCTRCNSLIKWKLLEKKANELGIYWIATGHYFKLIDFEGHKYISRAADAGKDQSYYLWGVGEQTLKRSLTPMSEAIKSEIKKSSHLKKESMGVCFLRGESYTSFLERECGDLGCGDILSVEGDLVGRHAGLARYTIGQRRGEGIPSGKRVVGVDAERNTLIVGEENLLYTKRLKVSGCKFININELDAEDIQIMIRGIGRNPSGFVEVLIDRNISTEQNLCVEVHLKDDFAWAAAPGQPLAFYRGERLIGGGYLVEAK